MAEKRKPPTTMPSTPEELLAFVAWPDYYENETEEEYKGRQKLCETLGKRYAEHMKKQVGALLTPEKGKVWYPNKK